MVRNYFRSDVAAPLRGDEEHVLGGATSLAVELLPLLGAMRNASSIRDRLCWCAVAAPLRGDEEPVGIRSTETAATTLLPLLGAMRNMYYAKQLKAADLVAAPIRGYE